jgi:hypothetical protein
MGAVSYPLVRADVFWQRQIRSTLVFRQVDQHIIARNLMGYAVGLTPLASDPFYLAAYQELPGSALPWMRFDDSMSGVLRDRLDDDSGYQGPRGMSVAEAVSNLSKVEDITGGARAALGLPGAFDYRLDYGRDPDGALWCKPVLGYPRLGGDVALPMDYPSGGVDWFKHAIDDSGTETMSRAVGSGSGVERLVGADAVDYEALSGEWPLLMGQESSNATLQASLDAAGRARLTERKGSNEGWQLRFSPDWIDRVSLGDTIAAVVDDPRWARPRRLPDYRMIGRTVDPGGPDRPETLTPLLQAA